MLCCQFKSERIKRCNSRASVAYLCLRCGLQVTQSIAEPLGSQAELAILLLDASHTLEHHFIILSKQNRLQFVSAHASLDAVSVCACVCHPGRNPVHPHTCPSLCIDRRKLSNHHGLRSAPSSPLNLDTNHSLVHTAVHQNKRSKLEVQAKASLTLNL